MALTITYTPESESLDGLPHFHVIRPESSEKPAIHFRRDPARVVDVADTREQIVVWEVELNKHGITVWAAAPEATPTLDELWNSFSNVNHFVRTLK